MLYTKLLCDKYSLYSKFHGYKLKKKIKEYKKALKNRILEAIKDKDLIIKFDELYEMYILIESYEVPLTLFSIVENKDSHILSFKYQLQNVIDLRIDLDPVKRDFRIRCTEIQIEYSIDYVFHINIKYTDYKDDSKEKDKQLILFINELIYSGYLKYLNIALDSEDMLNHKLRCEDIDEPYINSEELN